MIATRTVKLFFVQHQISSKFRGRWTKEMQYLGVQIDAETYVERPQIDAETYVERPQIT